MACPDCGKFRAQGKRFCGSCGADLSVEDVSEAPRITSLICPDCERFRQEGHAYCGTCGKYLFQPEQPAERGLNRNHLKPCIVAGWILAAVEIVCIWLSIPYVFTEEGLSIGLTILTPMPVMVARLQGIPMAVWYLALCLVLTFCVIHCAKRYAEREWRGVEDEDTAFFSVPVILGMSLILEYVVIIATSLAGGGIELDPDIYSKEMIPPLVNASVWEELVTRVCLIGLPMAIIALVTGRTSDGRPWYMCLAGGFGYSRIALVLVVFSSVFFGCAHMNWGLWKILPATIGGLAMGYVYMKHGLYASILMHMMTDVSLIPAFYGLGVSNLLFLLMIVLSLPGFIVYGRRMGRAYREGRL